MHIMHTYIMLFEIIAFFRVMLNVRVQKGRLCLLLPYVPKNLITFEWKLS